MEISTKTKYEETLEEIMDKIADDLASVPEPERSERIKAAVDYGTQRWPSKKEPRNDGNRRFPEQS